MIGQNQFSIFIPLPKKTFKLIVVIKYLLEYCFLFKYLHIEKLSESAYGYPFLLVDTWEEKKSDRDGYYSQGDLVSSEYSEYTSYKDCIFSYSYSDDDEESLIQQVLLKL